MTGNKETKSKEKVIALKDWHIFMPPKLDLHIKKGDDVFKLNLSSALISNLITEQVIKL